MLCLREIVAWLTIISSSTVSLFGGAPPFPAQRQNICSTINDVGVGCATFKFVGVERGKPFTAKRVVTSVGHSPDGTSKTVEWVELIARDSAGRIRFEQQGPFKPPDRREVLGMSNHEIERVMIQGDASGPLITIFDCFKGRSIVLQPGPQIAHVMQTCDTFPPFEENSEPYSNLIARLLSARIPPNLSVEDLGYKEVEGTMARGIRSTNLGTDKDGEWNGRPTRIWERWMSDELGATMLSVQSDLKAQSESRSRLTSISRIEPEASLFEIPPNYRISFTQHTPELGIKSQQ